MMCTLAETKLEKKVPSFQKVTLYLQYKIFHSDVISWRFCLFEDITDYHEFKKIKTQIFSIDRALSFCLQNSTRQKQLAA